MNDKATYHTLYLTGPPATGKSALVSHLKSQVAPLLTFSYSEVLAEYLNAIESRELTQSDIRSGSSRLVRPQHVAAIDDRLIQLVEENRTTAHIMIDSHAVTKEHFGYRVTPFTLEKLSAIRPTMIVMLYADAEVVRQRITADSQGRPQVSAFEADLHTQLQAAIAVSYSLHAGVPLYLLDSSAPTEELARQIIRRLGA
ncbi:MAG: AAA family ATPase [Armatimonadetes bacterium]|nr:AAA family ATPase [Armatimonadota bacterium]